MEDVFEYVDFLDVIAHGDPAKWKYLGSKQGSPIAAKSQHAHEGSMKHYELYEDIHGDRIELHFIRHSDGSVVDVKVVRP
jgi:hypothetical protein